MRLKLYQFQVLVGALLAALSEGLFITTGPLLAKGTVESIEAASFLFCCAGLITGGRKLRSAFDEHGCDKAVARRDPTYMRTRLQLQITSVASVAAMGVLAARRYGIDVAYPLLAALAAGVSLPLINRLSGWVSRGER